MKEEQVTAQPTRSPALDPSEARLHPASKRGGQAPGKQGRFEGRFEGRRGWRWAVGVALAMWACGFFVARVPNATRPEFSGASAVFVVAFALPSYAVLWRWAGVSRALQVLGALGAFALEIETLAVVTGWPYGGFSYGDAIGGKVAGLVPWTVPFAWTPLVLGTFALVRLAGLKYLGCKYLQSLWPQVLAGAVALAVADLVLDPGAVRQKFWAYDSPGAYYGVPASNYFGWMLSGLVGHAILHFLLRPAETARESASESAGQNTRVQNSSNEGERWAHGTNPAPSSRVGGTLAAPPAGLGVSLAWTLAFWSSVCLWAGLWAPAAIGHACLAFLWHALRPGAPASSRASSGGP